MLSFNALEQFLQVRPSLKLGQERPEDDLIVSPMRFPGTDDAVRVFVRPLPGGTFFLHDNAEAAHHIRDPQSLMTEPEWRVFHENWIANGLNFDEEYRLFTIASSGEEVIKAVARLLEAQVVVTTLALARRSR
ncbi:hypothetical protein EVA_10507 [gut metagenome]|uniref:Uncharacterized protein n=1 Tax=gut metagenome TaxID=749906 RepID=J9G2D7_9ZZZZ